MKKFALILLAFVLLLSCSKEKPKLQLFSPEAFAYELDNGYELDASVRVKGFAQEENQNGYFAKLSYNLDIVTPNGDTLKNAYDGLADITQKEEITDTQIEVQVEFDSSFAKGNYILLFSVQDNLSPQTASITDTVAVGL